MDENEKRERVLSLWLQNIPEEIIASTMEMSQKEVHKSIYMPSYKFIIMTRKNGTGPSKRSTGPRDGRGGGSGNYSGSKTGTGKKTGGKKGPC